jgi:NADH-quinone oxidoreductase subunit J
MREILLILFTVFTLGCALGVVFSKNPVYSAFNLVLAFFGLSVVYVLWGATFVAMIQVLVYTGAIVVLFLFVVMLLDLVRAPVSGAPGWLSVAVSGGCVWFFSLLLLRTLNRTDLIASTNTVPSNAQMKLISRLLFNEYLWPFEVLSVFMLAMIVAVYVLARAENEREEA